MGLSGCNTSSASAVGVTLTPSTTPGIDQAQTLAITASVAHDSKGAGVTWSVSGGGSLSGTPTTTSATYQAPASVTTAFTATVTATSVSDSSKSAVLQIKVSPLPAVTTSSLPAATAGSNYNQVLAESGGTSPYTWSVSPATLPPGLILVPSSGVIGGEPTGCSNTPCGSYTFTVTDEAGNSSSTQPIPITVGPPASPLTITPTTLPGATIGSPYSATMTATGGVPVYTWSLSGNPSWLSINPSTGVLSGTPTGTSGSTASFTVIVTDSQTPTHGTQSVGQSIVIVVGTLTITTASLPAATVSTSYSATVNATGGITPYTWSLSSNPSWLSINPSTGVLSGTAPGTPGTTPSFSVTVQDSESPAQVSVANFTITINAAQGCTGTLDNELLSGNYALMLNGWSGSTTAASAVGSFVADGEGNISGGLLDKVDQSNSAGPQNGTFTGTYCVGSNNLATINLNFSGGLGGGTATLQAALDASDGNGHIITYSSGGFLASGLLRKQNTAAFSTSAINGDYAGGGVGADSSYNRWASAGAANYGGNGNIANGEFDSDDAASGPDFGTFSSSDFTVASDGRGTAVITYVSGAGSQPKSFVYYIVSASEMLRMEIDPSLPPEIEVGQILQQSSNLSYQSLEGLSVIETQALDNQKVPATPEAQAGIFTVTSPPAFSETLDQNDSGTMSTLTPSGNYSVDSSGRVTLTAAGNSPPVFYLVGPNQAFLVGTDSTVSFGTLTPQTGSNFDNASLLGNYYGGSQQPIDDNVNEQVEFVNANGSSPSGSLNGISDTNGTGGPQTGGNISNTYVVSSSGRTVISGSSGAAILYIISPTQAVVLPSDTTNPALIDLHQ
ncbi:MAG: putative Ig domain-containing protein [Candidatus Binataceae bacterium]